MMLKNSPAKEGITIVNQVPFASQDSLLGIREIAGDLAHPNKPFAACAMPAISTLRVDKSMNRTRNRCNPRRVHTSTVKKSAATIWPQCRDRNSFHVVFRFRSGAGSSPCRSRI